jgi:hypothetical protein
VSHNIILCRAENHEKFQLQWLQIISKEIPINCRNIAMLEPKEMIRAIAGRTDMAKLKEVIQLAGILGERLKDDQPNESWFQYAWRQYGLISIPMASCPICKNIPGSAPKKQTA